MVTQVTRTVGSTGDDSTWALFLATISADNANLTSSDKQWTGEGQNQLFNPAAGVHVTGFTTDSTRYIELTTAAGASWADNASVQSDPYKFTTSYARITSSTNFEPALKISSANTVVRKLQFGNSALANNAINVLAAGCLIERCIGYTTGTLGYPCFSHAVGSGTLKVANSLFYSPDSSIVGSDGANTATFHNCTFATFASAAQIVSEKFGTRNYVNCIFLSNGYSGTPINNVASASTISVTYSATDATTLSGTGNLTSITPSNNIQSYSSGSPDFRAKSGGGIIDSGADLSANGTLAVTIDAPGTSRPQGSAFDMGAWELVSGGGGGGGYRASLRMAAQAVNRAATF